MHVREHGLPCVLVSDWCLAQVVLRSEGKLHTLTADSFNSYATCGGPACLSHLCVIGPVVLCVGGVAKELEVEVEGCQGVEATGWLS